MLPSIPKFLSYQNLMIHSLSSFSAESNEHYHQNYYCIISEKNLLFFRALKSDKGHEGVEGEK